MARRILADSTHLHSFSWEKSEPVSDYGQLDIWFKNKDGSEGAHYAYTNVPLGVVADLIFAESQAKFFDKQVKGQFQYERIS